MSITAYELTEEQKKELSEIEASMQAAGAKWKNIEKPGLCHMCDDEKYPVSHFGSTMCKSKGIAAPGGFRRHCTCDSCF